MKIAFPTTDDKGLDSKVSEVFARAETFTIIDIEENTKKIKNVIVIDNEAKKFPHGAGPIAVKTLLDNGVNAVATYDIGFGSKELLKSSNIKIVRIKAVKHVYEVLDKVISEVDSSIS